MWSPHEQAEEFLEKEEQYSPLIPSNSSCLERVSSSAVFQFHLAVHEEEHLPTKGYHHCIRLLGGIDKTQFVQMQAINI